MKREDANKKEYQESGKAFTRKELDARKGGDNEVRGSKDAARIQAKLRQMDRKDKRSSKR